MSATDWSLGDFMFERFRSEFALGGFLGLDEEIVEEIRWFEDAGKVSLVDEAEEGPEEAVKSVGKWRSCVSAGLVFGRDSMVR